MSDLIDTTSADEVTDFEEQLAERENIVVSVLQQHRRLMTQHGVDAPEVRAFEMANSTTSELNHMIAESRHVFQATFVPGAPNELEL